MGHDNSETSEEKHMTSEPIKLEEMVDNNNQNIVTSLAEKAMSVAAPVVPTKEDGAVDQERFKCDFCHFLFSNSLCCCGCLSVVLLLEQDCRNAGRIGPERWCAKTCWQISFTLGWFSWCYESDG